MYVWKWKNKIIKKKNLTKFVNHVTIKFRMRNTLSQERAQNTFVFTNERNIIPIMEFGEGYAKL